MGCAILTATLLLLIQYGNAENQTITVLTGDTINLSLSYSSNSTLIIWKYNNSILMAIWTIGTGTEWIADNYKSRLTLQEKQLSITNSATKDSGEYMATVTDTSGISRPFNFNVDVRERVLKIQSNDTGIYGTGANISLSIWYDGKNPSERVWFYNGNPLVIRTNSINFDSDSIIRRMVIGEKGSLLIYNTTKDDAGTYSINVTAETTIITNTTTIVSGSQRFQVKFYDPVGIVTVKQLPQVVSENTFAVNLSCSASSGYNEAVTWMEDGKSITNNRSYNLLDGNQTLQITQPNRTFSGNYSCNISNAVYWNLGSLLLRVYDPVGNVTVKQSPQVVSENTSAVNLSCSASSGYNETVTWMKDGQSITNNRIYNLLDGNQTLQITQPNRTFSGNYSCTVSNAVYWSSGSLQLRVYDPVVNVAVTQSPQKVNEGAAFVNLSCSASSGYTEMVTWMKDGQSVISKNPYSLLDGNRTLQITRPDRTFNGLYTCNISNAAYWGSGSLGLTISYATLHATSTYSMVIITLLGGILLAH
ncbi:hemicentin-1-like isoform X2 [Rana temporaria]|uniref:hemicentin-1-like isoform X2 n=1 Tax=Rana temporaria TaxID=8407 RepID=UPI001AAC7A6F|nr:hemicentin-1-like isoform X2 [Rana temporaria]